jgi:hypothetical protein
MFRILEVSMALVEASVEGRIDTNSIGPFALAGAQFKAIGITILFSPGLTVDPYPEPPPATAKIPRRKTIVTPQGEITVTKFLDLNPLPGRTAKGFEGGIVIADGFYDTVAKVFLADFLTVEPGETVVLGALTKNDPGVPGGQRVIEVNGMLVEMLTDARLPSNPDNPVAPIYENQYGFPMKIETAPLSPLGPNPTTAPAPSSVEGYFSETNEGKFYAFLFQSGDTGVLATDPAITPQIVIERVEYRDRGAQIEYDARGAVTTAHQNPPSPLGQDVQLFRVDIDPLTNLEVETSIGRATIDTREPGFERWRFRDRPAKPSGFRAGVPIKFRAKNLSGLVPGTGNPAEDVKEPDRVREK